MGKERARRGSAGNYLFLREGARRGEVGSRPGCLFMMQGWQSPGAVRSAVGSAAYT